MKEKYGLLWPDEAHDIFIDLACAKKWREPAFKTGALLEPQEHLLRACRALFTPAEFSISPWTEEHAYDWTHEQFCITWGAASTSKSNDYGCLSVLDWIVDPTKTVIIMASTSKEMLKLRSYEAVVRYFSLLKRNKLGFVIPGKVSRTTTAILNEDDGDDDGGSETAKASIRGVAVKEGSEDDARARLQGAHLPYVRLILDEMANMKRAAVQARVNLSVGAKDFRFFGLANPESFNDLSAEFSEPIDGWGSVTVDSTEWRSIYGKVRHHDGMKSPSILIPGGEEKWPYLIKQSDIDRIVREAHGNKDDRQVWTMVRGFPASQMVLGAPLTWELVNSLHMTETEIVRLASPNDDRNLVRVAGLDPAFTSGGDSCVLQFGELVRLKQGLVVLLLGDTIHVPVEASSKIPVTYQIASAVYREMTARQVPFENLAVDDSGTQSVADVLSVEFQVPNIMRVNNAARASELPVTKTQARTNQEAYINLGTEIWMLAVNYGLSGQLRGLSSTAAQQFCTRILESVGTGRKRIEPKKEYKKRCKGGSPDEGDAVALTAFAARSRTFFLPGDLQFNTAKETYQPGIFGLPQLAIRTTGGGFRSNYVDDNRWGRLSSYRDKV